MATTTVARRAGIRLPAWRADVAIVAVAALLLAYLTVVPLVMLLLGAVSASGSALDFQFTTRYLERVLTDGSTMAVCLGRSTYEVIHAISPDFQAKVRVAQAMGSMPFSMQEVDSATLARQLAQKLDGEVLYLSSPLMADNIKAAKVLRSQREINRVLKAARAADVALLGIGNLDPATSGFIKAGFITPAELAELTAAGAVGDVAGQIYTIEGQLQPCSYNQRVIGITLEELCQIPTSLAVAMGQAKAKAILGGLRTGAINVLCTDDNAAREVIRLNK